ncbi:MAG: winged helix-turn-helix transcriptional regulator [Gemmatimonadales bacterium]|nr:winged helix-turn-helix transcriptional regulator [Gemmatimonadales bacterium]
MTELLRQRLFRDVHLGVLRAGDRLPSIRELARDLDADPRAVLTAYHELERQGLVNVRPRSGFYLAGGGRTPGQGSRREADWVVELLVQSLASGVSAPVLRQRLPACLGAVRLRAACVECNADQIASLAGELQGDYGIEAAGIEVGDLGLSAVDQALADADVLVTTPFHIPEVQAAAQRLGRPWLSVSLRRTLFAELTATPNRGRGFFVVADPRFAAKLPRLFASTRSVECPVAMVVGWDDLDAIPETAPTYLTRLARERLGDCPLTRRVRPVRRVFSTGSSRRILSFLVAANLSARPDAGVPA